MKYEWKGQRPMDEDRAREMKNAARHVALASDPNATTVLIR